MHDIKYWYYILVSIYSTGLSSCQSFNIIGETTKTTYMDDEVIPLIELAFLDLSEGALFIISTKTGTTTVMQLNRDLSDVQPEYDSCVAFGENDPDVADFIMGNSNE